jgi:hypothetical protein
MNTAGSRGVFGLPIGIQLRQMILLTLNDLITKQVKAMAKKWSTKLVKEIIYDKQVDKIYSLRSSMASLSVRFGVRSLMLNNVGQSWDGWPKHSLSRASKDMLSRWSQLCASTHQSALGPRMARSPCVIYKEALCPTSGDINGLIMMMKI